MEIQAFASALGAVIHDVDLTRPLPAAGVDAIRQALADFGVVFFRDQRLTPEQHLGFAPLLRRDQRQPVLQDGRRLSGDRRSAQGA